MSKHGRWVVCGCGGKHPVNRKNLKAKNRPGGFKCPRCLKDEEYQRRQAREFRIS